MQSYMTDMTMETDDREYSVRVDDLRSYREEISPRDRTAYRAILNPIDFDNHRFWHLVYEAGLQDMISALAEAADFRDVLSPYPLGSDADATWRVPYLEDLVRQFHAHLSLENYHQIKDILRDSLVINSRLCVDNIEELFSNIAESAHARRETELRGFRGDDDLVPPATRHCGAPAVTLCPGFVGHPDFRSPSASNWMKILGGFMMALGAVAVAVAFAALNAATLGTAGLVVAGLGVASILGGVGLFRMGASPSSPPPSPPFPPAMLEPMAVSF